VSKQYSHLTDEKRELLSVLVAEGKKKTEIAKVLSCDRSTIYRELNRNGPPVHKRYYLSHKAHGRAINRKSKAHQRPKLKDQNMLLEGIGQGLGGLAILAYRFLKCLIN